MGLGRLGPPPSLICLGKHTLQHSPAPCRTQFLTFFFSLEEGSLPEQRPDSTPLAPFTRVEDLARLLSTSSSSNFFLLMNLSEVLHCQPPVPTQPPESSFPVGAAVQLPPLPTSAWPSGQGITKPKS